MENGKGAIHSIETFGSVDGPGVRYVIFCRDVACAVSFVIMRIPGKSRKAVKPQKKSCGKLCAINLTGSIQVGLR